MDTVRWNSRPSDGCLGPPQFSLRGLFYWIAGLSVLFGAMAWAGPSGAALLGLAALLIAGHVAGNSLVTKLRDRTSEALEKKRATKRGKKEGPF